MTEGKTPDGTWTQWSKFVLEELKRLNRNCETMDTRLQNLQEDMAALKVKSGLWGMIGGTIPLVVAVLLYMLKSGK